MRTPIRSTGLMITLLAFALPGLADSRLVFPRIVFQNGLFSGIAISNPTTEMATIRLTAYDASGSKLATAGTHNDVTPPSIPSGGQYLTLASQVFDPNSVLAGPTPKYYWVEVTSTTTGLAGFYLEGDSNITFQYGGDLGTHGTDLYLPAVENRGSTVTEISLVNADTSGNGGDANVTVDFLRADGQKVGTRNAVIARAASLQGPLATIPALSLPSFDEVSALRVHSNTPVVCYGIVRPQSGKTPIALPAEDATTPAKTLYFPQLAEGGGWATKLGIVNLNSAAQRLITISAYRPDGTLYVDSRITNPYAVTLGANGFLHKTIAELFPFSDTSYKDGWIKVEADSPSISGFIEYGAGANRAPVIAQLNSYRLSMFSHQAQAAPYFTGLAILNPGTLAANVEVFSLDNAGNSWGKTQIVLRPGQRTSQLLYQIVSASWEKTGGSVYVRSDRPVISTELFAKNDVTALANVPPQQVTTAFNPSGAATIAPLPALAVVETGKTQRFAAPGVSGPDWSVNGKKGGNADLGTITGDGVYQAPSKAPAPRTLTIQATSGNSTGASSIDVVQREELTRGLTRVTAVAYLETLRRFFVAEQEIVSPEPSTGFAATTADTQIYEVVKSADGTKNDLYLSIPDDAIAKMLPYDLGAASYLLLAGRESGKIYRLDVAGKVLKTVVFGLNQPNSMALDPTTRNVLVAEAGAGRITTVTPAQIAAASDPSVTASSPDSGRRPRAFPVPNIQGIAVDQCTGSVYISDSRGNLVEYQGSSRRVVETGLNHPTQLQAVWRAGFSCATALTIGIVEADRISLSYPKQQIPRTALLDNIQGIDDITFLPENNPFATGGEASVCVSQSSTTPNQGQVSDVPTGGVFQSTPPDPIDVLRGLYGGIGPNADPIGDTFDADFAAKYGYAIPDIVSVTGSAQGDQSVITIKFAAPFFLLGSYLGPGLGYDGLRAYIFMRANSDLSLSAFPVNFTDYFPFGDPATYVFDSYIWVSPGVGAGYVSASGQYPALRLSAIGDTLTLSLPPAALDLERTRALVMVGNSAEITDVAPNNGLVRLSTIPLVY